MKSHCLYGKSRIYCGNEVLATQTKSSGTTLTHLGQVVPVLQLVPNNTTRIKGIFPVSPPSAGVTQILAVDPKPGVGMVLQGVVRSFRLFPGSSTVIKLEVSCCICFISVAVLIALMTEAYKSRHHNSPVPEIFSFP